MIQQPPNGTQAINMTIEFKTTILIMKKQFNDLKYSKVIAL